METECESQTSQIYRYLNNGNTITPVQAFNMFNCFRLGARIKDLRDAGYNITTTIIRTNSNKRVAQYKLIQEPVQLKLF